MSIGFAVEHKAWKAADVRPALRAAIRTTLKSEGARGALTVLLADDETLQRLNRDFRGKDKPTNVLSFPAGQNAENYLGDIALSFETASREALEQNKPFKDHVLHLCVHAVLHLLGYDHENEAEAAIMEGKETALLKGMGIADPYLLPA